MQAPPGDLMDDRTMREGIQVHLKQVWKRKKDGLLVRVTGLIFLEPKRVLWRPLQNLGSSSPHEVTTETEFKQEYEYQPDQRAGET
jgi:hypothetical protein